MVTDLEALLMDIDEILRETDMEDMEDILKASRMEKIEHELKLVYAHHIKKLIPEIAKEKCFGCHVNHPSQVQHDICLMMSDEEKVNFCMETAMTRLNEDAILEEWKSFLEAVEAEVEDFEIFLSKSYRQTIWMDQDWLEEVAELAFFMM